MRLTTKPLVIEIETDAGDVRFAFAADPGGIKELSELMSGFVKQASSDGEGDFTAFFGSHTKEGSANLKNFRVGMRKAQITSDNHSEESPFGSAEDWARISNQIGPFQSFALLSKYLEHATAELPKA